MPNAIARPYETMYIIRSDVDDASVTATIAKYEAILGEHQAAALETKNLGKRRLAYEIRKHREGIYVQMNYNALPTCVAAMEKSMRIDENVIRFLTMRQDDLDTAVEKEDQAS